MSWLDAFLTAYNTVQSSGVQLIQRNVLNFGAGFTVVDDVAGRRTTITASGGTVTGPPPRGLMMQLNTSLGMFVDGSNKPVNWRDQAPARLGKAWLPTGGVFLPNATNINGLPTVEFEGLTGGNPDYQLYEPGVAAGSPAITSYLYSPNELSIATVAKYTGSLVASPNGTYIIPTYSANQLMATIAGQNYGPNPSTAGLCGGQYSGDASKVVFLAWVYDNPVAGGSWDITHWKFVVSAPVPKAVGHYVVMTFGLGVLSIYVDNLAPVTLNGVGPIVCNDFYASTDLVAIGCSNGSGYSAWTGSILEVDGWNVCLTGAEVAAEQAWLVSAGGFP